ncbi:MAG TPA: ABC transporter ATP-binding protein [Oligoflexia bacterium]|nr:ABC transporter ATP-binding protein [Oligoflexia bacterium]HMR24500.1 ABC transporter ATP-binding protein [Oligoflexia bacterium]
MNTSISNKVAIAVNQVSKSFGSQNSSYSFVINALKKLFMRKQTLFNVLDDISFEVYKGESFGIIGKNGSGKSTLLKIIAGVTSADKGNIETHGNIISLLEVGAGFSPLLSGLENIYLNASLNGLEKGTIDSKLNAIIEFSGIADSIHKPLYQYSSGMAVRLGFSIAVHSNPDILIVDEALAVGDTNFQGKCIDKILSLKQSGCTILFVSHDLSMVSGLCDRALFLNDCKVAALGQASQVVSSYLQFCGDDQSHYKIEKGDLKLYFNAGNIGIAYKNQMLSKAYGLYTSIYAYKTWHDSDQMIWQLEEKNDSRLSLIGKMRRLPIYQMWTIDLLKDNCFELSIYLKSDSKQDISADEIQTSILLLPNFQNWQIQNKTGQFISSQKNLNQWQQLAVAQPKQKQSISAHNPVENITVTFSQTKGLASMALPLITSKELNSSVLQYLHLEALKLNDTQEKALFFKGQIKITTK